MNLVIVTVFTCFAFLETSLSSADGIDSPCGDWEQYKDEHCYKLLENVGLQSYSNAENACQTNNGTLVSIHYAEEQNFLSNYIFTKKKAVDNVWIGAKYVGNKMYQWEDHTSISSAKGDSYSNWATGSPKNLADYCVQMQSDVGLVGKWVDEPCARKNLVVCQKTPPLSMKLLSETMIEIKHSLQQTVGRLAETEKEIVQLKSENSKLIPIGFTYVQMPKDKAPSELWPSMTWKEISSEYAGVFFRVAGGHAADFGQIQEASAPRLEVVNVADTNHRMINQNRLSINTNLTLSATGGWSDAIFTGGNYNTPVYMSFKQSAIADVRPKNMAIVVWKRVE